MTVRAAGRVAGDERGAELVEFALTLPLLLLVMVAVFDFGLLFQQYQGITNASREGARIAVLPGYAAADVEARVASYLAATGISEPATVTVDAVAVTPGGGPAFGAMRVTVDCPYRFMWLGPVATLAGGAFSTVPLRAVTTMRLEGP